MQTLRRSVADITILESILAIHKRRLKKRGEDNNITVEGESQDKFLNYWDVPLNKGYQGSGEMFRALAPHKKPPRGVWTPEQERVTILVKRITPADCCLCGISCRQSSVRHTCDDVHLVNKLYFPRSSAPSRGYRLVSTL